MFFEINHMSYILLFIIDDLNKVFKHATSIFQEKRLAWVVWFILYIKIVLEWKHDLVFKLCIKICFSPWYLKKRATLIIVLLVYIIWVL